MAVKPEHSCPKLPNTAAASSRLAEKSTMNIAMYFGALEMNRSCALPFVAMLASALDWKAEATPGAESSIGLDSTGYA